MTDAIRKILGKRYELQEQRKSLQDNDERTDIEQRRFELLTREIDDLTTQFHRLASIEFEAKRDAAEAHCQGPYVL